MRSFSAVAVGAMALMTVNVDAFWRMPCRARSGLARLDPLMNPGALSAHAHSIHGSSGFSETSTYEELMGGDCTSCSVTEDMSAYWTPNLYFQDENGDFTLVEQVGGMLAYYLLYTNSDNTSLSAFPEGFRMIAGNNLQRNFTWPVPDPPKSEWSGDQVSQFALEQKALGFNCLNYNAAAEGSLYRHFLPDKDYLDANCVDGVRFELMFPSCWNGKDLDSDNHKSHVAYPDLVMTGTCPEDYPIRLVSLFYETIWATNAFAGKSGQFVISNGDPTGYGYHGDFIMGWNESFLQEAVDTCTNLSGEIEDCPLFTIQDSDTYSNCNITLPSALAHEDVVGPMPNLPGNLPIQSGPQKATEGTAKGATSIGNAAVPTLSYSAGSTLASSATYLPGGVFKAVNGDGSSTITSAPSSTSDAPQYVSTDFVTSGNVVDEILWVEQTETVTLNAPTPATAATTATGAPLAYRHAHAHARRAHGHGI